MAMASMDLAFRRAILALARFPLAIALSFAGMGAGLRLNHIPIGEAQARDHAVNLLLAACLGVGLLFSLAVSAESRKWPRSVSWTMQGLGLALIIAYYQTLPMFSFPVRIIRFWLFIASVHLFAMLAPALGRNVSVTAFWQFNQRVGARLVFALGFSLVIYLGVVVALASVKNLFEIPVPDAFFLDPGIAVLGGFNTWFLLSGVPLPQPDAEARPYPRQMRILAEFILLPLVTLYLLILYAYAAKVLVAWKWPTGWASYLILGLCALGLFTLVLLKPLEEKSGNRWVRLFGRHFHHALIPLLLLLFVAIGRRVIEYGITEKRYCVIALAVWLSGITLHSMIDRRRDIRVLPASLCLVWLLAAFGPWGVFDVSRKSQVARLQGVLEANGMLVGNKLAKSPSLVPRRANQEISSIAHYLEEHDALRDLEPWVPAMDDSGQTHSVAWHRALDNKFAFVEALELPYLPPARRGPGQAEAITFSCRSCSGPVKKVSGYDFLFVDYQSGAPEDQFQENDTRDQEGLRFDFDRESGVLRFSEKDSAGPSLDLSSLFQRLRERYPDAYELNLPEDEMYLEQEDKNMRVGVRLRNLTGEAADDTARLREFAADVFVKLKGRGGARTRR
jgi:hypothetical protein